MSTLTPYKNKNNRSRLYRANDRGYSFTFLEDGSALDLTALTDITVKLFRGDTTVWEHTVSGGDLAISGTDNQTISGTVDAETLDIEPNDRLEPYYLEVIFDNGGAVETYVALFVDIIDADSPYSTTAWDFELDINSETQVVDGQPTQVLAQAIQAKNDAEAAFNKLKIPFGVILVDGQFSNNSGVQYDDIDLAITAARARIADDWDKAVIKAYLDSSGVPIGLGDNDYYDLQDEGIYFESEFDRWDDYVTKGGTLLQSDLLYDIKQSELSIDING